MTATQQMQKTQLKPLGARVIAQRLEAQDTVRGGIILPDTAKKKQETAKVIAVGTGKQAKNGQTIEISVKVGDVILMDKYSGQEVTLDDQEYIIVRAEDIIAIIE